MDRRGGEIDEGATCAYTAASGPMAVVSVYHEGENFDGEWAFKGALDLAGEPDLDGGGTDPTMIDGLGDRAFVDENEIHVLSGVNYFKIVAATEDAAILESVARAMLPRL